MQVVTAGSLAGAAFFQFFIDHIADAPPSHAPVGEVRRFFRRPADETLEDRINELLHVESDLVTQVQGIAQVAYTVQRLLNQPLVERSTLAA